jgi:hypothetical protein
VSPSPAAWGHLDESMRGRYLDWEFVARSTVMNFRAAVACNLDEPETNALVDHLDQRLIIYTPTTDGIE